MCVDQFSVRGRKFFGLHWCMHYLYHVYKSYITQDFVKNQGFFSGFLRKSHNIHK